MRSKFGRLNLSDFIGGLFLAVIVALCEGTIQSFTVSSNLENMNYYPMISSSVIAFCSYIIKNLLKNSDGKYMQPEKDMP